MVDPEHQLGIGELGTQGTSLLETRFLSIINNANREAGERPDPWEIYDGLNVLAAELSIPTFEQVTPEQKAQAALANDIARVSDAFLIDAFPFIEKLHQETISRRIHGFFLSGTRLYKTKPDEDRSQESITLTEHQKGILQKITAAAAIPDNPGQLTYSFASIPPPTRVVRGNVQH